MDVQKGVRLNRGRLKSSRNVIVVGMRMYCCTVLSLLCSVVVITTSIASLVVSLQTTTKKSNNNATEDEITQCCFKYLNTENSSNCFSEDVPPLAYSSCARWKQVDMSLPSGDYWLMADNGPMVRHYCDMTLSCGGITGGWTRIVHLDTQNIATGCPAEFRGKKVTFTDEKPLKEGCQLDSLRTCAFQPNEFNSCSKVTLHTDLPYSRVCGRIIGYPLESVNVIKNKSSTESYSQSDIRDSITISHGSESSHIWTFAVASSRGRGMNCHCNTSEWREAENQHSFCDSPVDDERNFVYEFVDPLWDSISCGKSTDNSPPWFYRSLLHNTSDDIVLSMCKYEAVNGMEIGIQILDILVQ